MSPFLKKSLASPESQSLLRFFMSSMTRAHFSLHFRCSGRDLYIIAAIIDKDAQTGKNKHMSQDQGNFI